MIDTLVIDERPDTFKEWSLGDRLTYAIEISGGEDPFQIGAILASQTDVERRVVGLKGLFLSLNMSESKEAKCVQDFVSFALGITVEDGFGEDWDGFIKDYSLEDKIDQFPLLGFGYQLHYLADSSRVVNVLTKLLPVFSQ